MEVVRDFLVERESVEMRESLRGSGRSVRDESEVKVGVSESAVAVERPEAASEMRGGESGVSDEATEICSGIESMSVID